MAKKFFNLVFVIFESYKPSNAYTRINKFGGVGIRTPEPVAQLLPSKVAQSTTLHLSGNAFYNTLI